MTQRLCSCGCGGSISPASRPGTRFVKNHSKRRSPVDYVVVAGPLDTPCWIWQHSRSPAGYGMVDRGGYRGGAHRWMYIRAHGDPGPQLHIDHLCRQPACVNPEHLEAVSPAENARRGTNAHLDWEMVQAARDLLASGLLQREVAVRLGVTQQTISRLARGESWATGVAHA